MPNEFDLPDTVLDEVMNIAYRDGAPPEHAADVLTGARSCRAEITALLQSIERANEAAEDARRRGVTPQEMRELPQLAKALGAISELRAISDDVAKDLRSSSLQRVAEQIDELQIRVDVAERTLRETWGAE